MVDSQAFKRSFICAGVFWALFNFYIIATNNGINGNNFSFLLGYMLVPWLISGKVTEFWTNRSNKPWNWLRYAVTVVGFWCVANGLLDFVGNTRNDVQRYGR
jgi:hypothetical protein